VSAQIRIQKLNPHVVVEPIQVRIIADNALENLSGCALVVDATDNYKARYILSDACVLLGIPLVSGSAIGFEGQITVLCTSHGPW
jgi:molybdopterin/thiamine biosynthesis adenylyltransferase